MTTIEQKEIRGLTVRHAAIYLFGIISLVATLSLGYSNIMTSLKESRDSNEVLKMNIETIKINQNTTDLRLKVLEVQVNDLIQKNNK